MCQDLILGHRVERDPSLCALRPPSPIVVVVGPVHEKHIGGRGLTVGVVLPAFERSGNEARREPRHELHETELIAPRSRQGVNLVVRDVRADSARRHFDDG